MRLIGWILALVLLVVIGREVVGDRLSADGAGAGVASMGTLPSSAPKELRDVFGSLDGARREVLPDFLGGGEDDEDAAPAAMPDPPFADSGGAREITRVKRAVRTGLRAETVRGRVVAWQGVIVAGDRAVVRADVEQLVPMASGKRVARPAQRVTLGLLRDDGWQLVTGQR